MDLGDNEDMNAADQIEPVVEKEDNQEQAGVYLEQWLDRKYKGLDALVEKHRVPNIEKIIGSAITQEQYTAIRELNPVIDRNTSKQQKYQALGARNDREGKVLLKGDYAKKLYVILEAQSQTREGKVKMLNAGWTQPATIERLITYIKGFDDSSHSVADKQRAEALVDYNYSQYKYAKKQAYECSFSPVILRVKLMKQMLEGATGQKDITTVQSLINQFVSQKLYSTSPAQIALENHTNKRQSLTGGDSVVAFLPLFLYLYQFDVQKQEINRISLIDYGKQIDERKLYWACYSSSVMSFMMNTQGLSNKIRHWSYRGYNLSTMKSSISITNTAYYQIVVALVPSSRDSAVRENMYVIPHGETLSIDSTKYSVDDYIMFACVGVSNYGTDIIINNEQTVFDVITMKFWTSMLFNMPDKDVGAKLKRFNAHSTKTKPNLSKYSLNNTTAIIGTVEASNGIVVFQRNPNTASAKGFDLAVDKTSLHYNEPISSRQLNALIRESSFKSTGSPADVYYYLRQYLHAYQDGSFSDLHGSDQLLLQTAIKKLTFGKISAEVGSKLLKEGFTTDTINKFCVLSDIGSPFEDQRSVENYYNTLQKRGRYG